MLEIITKSIDDGFAVEFKNTSLPVIYPHDYWNKTPEQTRLALVDNLALATTMHLPIVFNEPEIVYKSGRPLLESYFVENFFRDIPSCTDVDGTDTVEYVRRFFNTQYRFLDPVVKVPSDTPVDSGFRAIIGMSFGKDSLLTYAIADELELDPEMAYFIEPSMTYEEKHKTALAEQFKKEFNKDLHIIKHETGKLRDYPFLGLPFSEFGWALQSTEYALECIPLAYALQGKYILFGNEQTTSATYMDKYGWLVNPCWDQTHNWTVHIDQMTKMFSGRSVSTGSLIEPLMDMMVQRILVHRYPKYAKYQMSCFTETESGRDYRWCHHCTICAKMYLLCEGGGVDPALVGFKENMLDREHRNRFTLFGGSTSLTYLHSETAMDEQLFAFYSAARKNAKGELVEDFKASELFNDAKNREDELFKKFISIYEPISIPTELKDRVLSILKEEVDSFEI
ncbi:MAG: hypothetical protein ACFFE3_05190 [Candidatus Thorarchaeota archaeon]